MQEFLAVSVSSYEAESLAPKLSELSTAGWSVVSIVPAGSSITAYLSRAAGSVAAEPTETATEGFGGEETGAIAEPTPQPEPAFTPEPEPVFTPEPVAPAIEAPVFTPEPEPVFTPEPEPVSAAPTLADEVAALVPHLEGSAPSEPTAEPTTEAAGWGVGSGEPSLPGSVTEAVAETAEPVVAEAAAVTETVTDTAATAATAPGGWYADPSGRYELRYWDGTQWTEHVSRAGQQFTDPPVA